VTAPAGAAEPVEPAIGGMTGAACATRVEAAGHSARLPTDRGGSSGATASAGRGAAAGGGDRE
jgi:hypothetical protein